jgi:hypothetical protein
LLVGALFVITIGFLHWTLNQFVRFNLFDYEMVAIGALVFAMAIPSALLLRALTRVTK